VFEHKSVAKKQARNFMDQNGYWGLYKEVNWGIFFFQFGRIFYPTNRELKNDEMANMKSEFWVSTAKWGIRKTR
jgi:hypothetical protein